MYLPKTWMIFAAVASASVPAMSAAPISGRWITQSKDGVVEIYACGPALCGKSPAFS